MLTALTIQNVVIIEKLMIHFRSGLCALTGETGAGKSILLDSLGLAIGARAESRLVRKGAEKAIVSAEFDITNTHLAYQILEDADVMVDKGEPLVLRRSLTPDGRSKAYINDQAVSASLLRSVGHSLLEIHGQFDTGGLLDMSTHRGILDEYAGVVGVLEELWNSYKSAQNQLIDLQERQRKAREDEEYLRSALEDLDALEPQSGEEEKLAQLRERLMNREHVMQALDQAYHVLVAEDDPLQNAMGILARITDKLPAEGEEILNTLERASVEMSEAVNLMSALSSDIQESEHDLTSIDDRLFGLRAQARKHSCSVDDLADVREKIAAELNTIEYGDDLLEQAMRDLDAAKAAYQSAAQKVSEQRKTAAQKLDSLVAQELPPLKLERAHFITKIKILEEERWGPHGIDEVKFLVSTNPGAEPGPLNKIASGGEMSRFMLALKVVMAEVGSAPTLIFDEVDAGIGGGTADAVGQRLAKLAASKQILVVTHSPQVAAKANHQWIVEKSGDTQVTTNVHALPDIESRREEIARMISGASVTQEARAAAEKLLETGRAA